MKVTARIPKVRLDNVKRALDKINARLAKLAYGACVLTVTGESFESVVRGRFNGRIPMLDVEIAGPEVKIGDSELQVRIDHRQQPAEFRFYTDEAELPVRYLEAKSHCEHCGYVRQRNVTFVLYRPDEHRHIQVGQTCLEDFLKVSPEQALKAANLLDAVRGMVEAEEKSVTDETAVRELPVLIELADYLPYVAAAIRRYGWVSAKEGADGYALSSWQQARKMREAEHEGMPELTDEDRKVAQNAVAKLRADVPRETYYDDFWGNLAEIAHQGVCEERRLPTAALIVREYLRESLAAEAKAKDAGSKHFGTVGTRQDMAVEVLEVKPIFSTYGTKWYHRFRTPDGNIAVWFGSKTIATFVKGATTVIKATVKDHEEYRGIKQTLLARVALR